MTRFRPGPIPGRLLVVLSAVALAVPLVPQLVWILCVILFSIAAFALVEALLLSRIAVFVDRPRSVVLSLDEEEPIPVAVWTNAPRPVRVVLRQRWPSLVDSPSSTGEGWLRPGERLGFSFSVRAIARGAAPLEKAHVALTFWSFSERIVPAGEAGSLAVVPNLKAVRRLHGQLNRHALRGPGSRAAARVGKGREFDRLRGYVSGDDFRDVAWKASARHRKLIVREFRLDRSQDVLVCLDRGHRMAARVGAVSRLDHAVNAAVLLAYICNRMEDRLGILSFAARVEAGPAPARGRAHLRQATRFLTELEPAYAHADYMALASDLRRRLRHRTLVLLLTTLPELEEEDEIVRAVAMLAPQHLPLVVAFSDPALAASARFLPSSGEELSRVLVARDIVNARTETVRQLRRRGALVIEPPPGDAGLEAINAYIDVKRRQLL
jgi:uncharacterized protein (DUF58 family)